jgi:hypothetical protein
MTSEVREAEYILLLKLLRIALEINRRDLTNRVSRGQVWRGRLDWFRVQRPSEPIFPSSMVATSAKGEWKG